FDSFVAHLWTWTRRRSGPCSCLYEILAAYYAIHGLLLRSRHYLIHGTLHHSQHLLNGNMTLPWKVPMCHKVLMYHKVPMCHKQFDKEFANSFNPISESSTIQLDEINGDNLLIEEIIDLSNPAFIGNNNLFIEEQGKTNNISNG
ncbi:1226_t:CDS:2, partial [Racocetra persica]